MKIPPNSSSRAFKPSRSTGSNPSPQSPISEIFKNSRSLSKEEIVSKSNKIEYTINDLLMACGIPREKLKLPETKLEIGLRFLNGIPPITGDKEQALVWITKAAEGNHPRAQYILGESYAHGTFTKENPFLAFRWLKKAADNGNADARSLLDYFKNQL
jgi:TPR repeat protein